MEKYKITLMVEEISEEMAYQLLAIAIKKKFKKQVRPCLKAGNQCDRYHMDDIYILRNKESQNNAWQAIAGQPYDY
jgi:hypothetical protein